MSDMRYTPAPRRGCTRCEVTWLHDAGPRCWCCGRPSDGPAGFVWAAVRGMDNERLR